MNPAAPRGKGAAFLRSAGLRLAAVYGVLFAASGFALVLFLWFGTGEMLRQQVQAAIDSDTLALVEHWRDGGVPELAFAITERIAEDVQDEAIYLVVDRRGAVIAGNLKYWPLDAGEPGQTHTIKVSRAGVPVDVASDVLVLPGNLHLLVGRDIRNRADFIRMVGNTLIWAGLLVAVLGIAGAFVMRNLFRRMLADVSATADAIAGGDLTQRVRLRGRGDEFDRMAETINTMLDRIARLMDGVRQVSNAIAHDLRTPIARARARLEDAGEHAQGEPDLRAAVERAVADLDGVTSVFQALLRIAEIEAGSRRSAFAQLDLGPLLGDMAELYAAVAEERGLRMELRVPETLPILGDRDMLQQALANLLDNAIKFSPPGGLVRLSGAAVGAQVRLEVADQGPGIPPAELGRATERFYRGETARSTPGSGLGLALVQAVAGLHGGTLVLEDRAPGLGAALCLPLRMNAASSAPHANAIAASLEWGR